MGKMCLCSHILAGWTENLSNSIDLRNTTAKQRKKQKWWHNCNSSLVIIPGAIANLCCVVFSAMLNALKMSIGISITLRWRAQTTLLYAKKCVIATRISIHYTNKIFLVRYVCVTITCFSVSLLLLLLLLFHTSHTHFIFRSTVISIYGCISVWFGVYVCVCVCNSKLFRSSDLMDKITRVRFMITFFYLSILLTAMFNRHDVHIDVRSRD